ncbi:hypothetical protein U1Q18_028651, partial [Sarracenia purpurea var. burkii]
RGPVIPTFRTQRSQGNRQLAAVEQRGIIFQAEELRYIAQTNGRGATNENPRITMSMLKSACKIV